MWIVVLLTTCVLLIVYGKYLVKLSNLVGMGKKMVRFARRLTEKPVVIKEMILERKEHCYLAKVGGVVYYMPAHPNLEYREGMKLVGYTFTKNKVLIDIPQDYPLYCTPRQLGFSQIMTEGKNRSPVSIGTDELIDKNIYVPEVDIYASTVNVNHVHDPYI